MLGCQFPVCLIFGETESYLPEMPVDISKKGDTLYESII